MKVYAFIDSQNLNLGVKSQGWKLDFARFRVLLKDKYKVDRVFIRQRETVKNYCAESKIFFSVAQIQQFYG